MTHKIYGTVEDSLNDSQAEDEVVDTYAMDGESELKDKQRQQLNYELKLSFKQHLHKSSSQNDVTGRQAHSEQMTSQPPISPEEEMPRRTTVDGSNRVQERKKKEKRVELRRSHSAGELQPSSALDRIAFWKWLRPWRIFSSSKKSAEKASPCRVKRSKSATVSTSASTKRRQSGGKLVADLVANLERSSPTIASDVRLLKDEGSYYAIDRESAETRLKKYQIGTYLVRPNSTCDSFCLSYVVHLDKVEHTDIRRVPPSHSSNTNSADSQQGAETFQLVGKSDAHFLSLVDIVNMGRNKGFDVISASKSRLTFFLESPPMDIALRPDNR